MVALLKAIVVSWIALAMTSAWSRANAADGEKPALVTARDLDGDGTAPGDFSPQVRA